MRILLHSAYFSPELTSIGKYNGEMARWLLANGHEVRVVCMAPHYPAWQVMEGYSSRWYARDVQDGVPVWRCPTWIPARPTGGRRLLSMGLFALSSLPILVRQAFWRPHVVIGVEPPLLAFFSASLLAFFTRAHLWLHVQDLEVDAAFDLGILKGARSRALALGVERWLMRRCDRVSTISWRMMDRLRAKRVKDHKLVMFRNWVDLSDMRPRSRETAFRAELGLAAGDKLVLYAGNMAAKQGLETLMQAAAALVDRTDIHVLLVGDGPAREGLETLARGLARVHFLPIQPQERLSELLFTADVQVMPQRAAAADLVMPSKLGGMMASGRPVLAGAWPGTEIADVLAERGLVVPPEDGEALARGIVQLIDDPALADRLGKAARDYAGRELDKDAVLRKFESDLLRL